MYNILYFKHLHFILPLHYLKSLEKEFLKNKKPKVICVLLFLNYKIYGKASLKITDPPTIEKGRTMSSLFPFLFSYLKRTELILIRYVCDALSSLNVGSMTYLHLLCFSNLVFYNFSCLFIFLIVMSEIITPFFTRHKTLKTLKYYFFGRTLTLKKFI